MQSSVQKGRINAFVLKILAILGMTANHIAHVFSDVMPWELTLGLYVFGGVTYPTMAFLLVEGFHYTSNIKRYASRLFIFALLAQVPFSLCFGMKLNVLFTLLISLGLLWVWDHTKSRWVALAAFLGAEVLSYFCDWAISGPVIVLLFYLLREKGAAGVWITLLFPYAYVLVPRLIQMPGILGQSMENGAMLAAGNVISDYDFIYMFGIPLHMHPPMLSLISGMGYALVGFTLAGIFLSLYNGQRGRSMKWFFYAYYPLHLLVIWCINEVIKLI